MVNTSGALRRCRRRAPILRVALSICRFPSGNAVEKEAVIRVIKENGSARDPSIHQVVDRAGSIPSLLAVLSTRAFL